MVWQFQILKLNLRHDNGENWYIHLGVRNSKSTWGVCQHTREHLFENFASLTLLSALCFPCFVNSKQKTKNHQPRQNGSEALVVGKQKCGNGGWGTQSVTNVGNFHLFGAYDATIFIQILWSKLAKLRLLDTNPKVFSLNPLLYQYFFCMFHIWSLSTLLVIRLYTFYGP